MRQKFIGFAFLTIVSLTACQNVFNKDKTASTDSIERPKVVVVVSKDSAVFITKSQEPKDSNLKYVYLTFDDGPDAGTLNCYDICKNKGVSATFFLVGEHAENRWGKRILDTMRKDMRHFIFANHSYSHAHNRYISFYQHSATAFQDFIRSQDSLQFQVAIVRFPGNPAWVMDNKFKSSKLTKPLAKLMDSVGYNVMGWDIEWNFDKQSHPVQSAEQMARQIENEFASQHSFIKNHVVLLSHDRMFKQANYRDSLAKMITILQAKKDYVFETADQYPILKKADKNLLAMRK